MALEVGPGGNPAVLTVGLRTKIRNEEQADLSHFGEEERNSAAIVSTERRAFLGSQALLPD